jgi:membrane protein implicated in regulation of membrane protease activity
MDAVTITFLAIGCFSLLLLVLSLVGGHAHLGHLHLGHLHVGHLHVGHLHVGTHAGTAGDSGGIELTLPAIAGFLGAFGFGGAIAASLFDGHGAGTVLLALFVGLVLALPAAWAGGRLMRAAMDMNTDGTLQSSDLVGATGVVISPVPADGYGAVRLAVAGQQIRFNARSDEPLALGTRVLVIEVPTSTSVLVEPTAGIGLTDPTVL